ncbi:putative mitochondrial protein, conserved [Didymella heteroderae]|uniref:Succinate dehydrogenase assembly factor 4, mitochondrial n=1 Tax=Didymella heteroderae TaxID=1769908 RepID=A0A9P4X1W2_9PLEO|nr:putative mitochondrial protein, conserved [Didymella heteroderae]
MLRTFTQLPRQLSRRAAAFSTSTAHKTAFGGPAPPRLPREEQELFEKLQKQSTGAFSQPKPDPEPTSQPDMRMKINQSPDSSSEPEIRFENGKDIKKGEEFHPNMRRGAPPEFEGDVNPKTGEVGGPKNEPLRWGSGEGRGDWSYNGRVTDF